MTDDDYQRVGTLVVRRGLTPVQALHTASSLARRPVGRPTLPQSIGLAQAYVAAAQLRPLLVTTIVLGGQVYPVEALGAPPFGGYQQSPRARCYRVDLPPLLGVYSLGLKAAC